MSNRNPGNRPNDNQRIHDELELHYQDHYVLTADMANHLATWIIPQVAIPISINVHKKLLGRDEQLDPDFVRDDANEATRKLLLEVDTKAKWIEFEQHQSGGSYTGWLQTVIRNEATNRRRREDGLTEVSTQIGEAKSLVEVVPDARHNWRDDLEYVTDDPDQAEATPELEEPLKLFPVTDDEKRAHALMFPKPRVSKPAADEIAQDLGITRVEFDRHVERCWDRIIFLRLYCGQTMTAIADEWGISTDYVSPRIERVKRILRRGYGFDR